jgi:hypothetical protein
MDEGLIRVFVPADLRRLQEITQDAFEPVSIDRNIERKYGVINGVDWKTRKADHIRIDAEREAEGIFVLECDDQSLDTSPAGAIGSPASEISQTWQ